MPFEELKRRQAVLWSAGPYQGVTETITDIHRAVVESLDPQPGQRLLDLACGTGAVAELAAAAGAEVVGVDIAPALIEQAEGSPSGRARAGESDEARRPYCPGMLETRLGPRRDLRHHASIPAAASSRRREPVRLGP